MALTDGLYAYYKLDSNSSDPVGRHNGVDTNVEYGSGKIGGCGEFNGVDSTIIVANSSAFEITTGTIVFWFNSSVAETYQPVMAMNDNTNDNWFIASSWVTAGTIGVYDLTTVIETKTMVCDGNWHLIGISSSSVEGVTFRVDGMVDIEYPGSNMYSGAVGAPVNIGFRAFDSIMVGKLDEIGFRDRILTSDEHTLLRNSGNGLSYPFNKSGAMFLTF